MIASRVKILFTIYLALTQCGGSPLLPSQASPVGYGQELPPSGTPPELTLRVFRERSEKHVVFKLDFCGKLSQYEGQKMRSDIYGHLLCKGHGELTGTFSVADLNDFHQLLDCSKERDVSYESLLSFIMFTLTEMFGWHWELITIFPNRGIDYESWFEMFGAESRLRTLCMIICNRERSERVVTYLKQRGLGPYSSQIFAMSSLIVGYAASDEPERASQPDSHTVIELVRRLLCVSHNYNCDAFRKVWDECNIDAQKGGPMGTDAKLKAMMRVLLPNVTGISREHWLEVWK